MIWEQTDRHVFLLMPNGDIVTDPGKDAPADDEIPIGFTRDKSSPCRFHPDDDQKKADGCKGCGSR